MRIMRVLAHFGVLDGVEVTFAPGRLQLVVDANERGKSTLVAAILSALYGLPSSRTPSSEFARCEPLRGDRFAVELDLQAEGRRLRIQRDFRRGNCTIADRDTVRDLTDEFQTGKNAWDVGQRLLGLSREQFLRSGLVRQQDCAQLHLDKEAVTLTTRLQQLVDTSAGENTADAAIEMLDGAMRAYNGVTFKGTGNVVHEARTLRAQVEHLGEQLTALRQGRACLDDDADRLARLLEEARGLRAARDEAGRLAVLAEAQAARERLARDDERRGHREQIEAELAALGPAPAIRPEQAEQLATFEGRIHAFEEQIESERLALAAAERRLDESEARAGTKSYDLAERFERLAPADEERLASYPRQRGELLSALVSAREAPAAARPSFVVPAVLAAAALLLGILTLFRMPALGVPLVAIGAGLAIWGFRRRPHGAPAQSPAGRVGLERRLRDVDSAADAIARRLGYADAAAVLNDLQQWQQLRPLREEWSARRDRLKGLRGQRTDVVQSYATAAGVTAETATERAAALERARAALRDLGTRSVLEGRLREIDDGVLTELERGRLARARTAAAEHEVVTTNGRSAEDYRVEAARLTQELEEDEHEAQQLQLRIGAALDDFEREHPRLEAELDETRAALMRAEGFADAAGLARTLLAEVAEATHRDWARRLNQNAGAILSRFATDHLDHTELRFSQDLDFVVRDRDGTEWSRADLERRLSAGARDQIYLAIRFALATYFSPDPRDPLPLILDDPLVTSDDDRFAAVMGYLLDQATTRQVIVLTCHEQRHRLWLQSIANAEERVQWLRLRAGRESGEG